MPELPEVETIARQLRRLVVGRRIARFRSEWHRLTEPEPAELFAVRLAGRTIHDVRRRGKLVVLELGPPGAARGPSPRGEERPEALIVSLRMTGQLLFHDRGTEAHPYRRAHIAFDDGTALEFADTRKFGRMAIVDVAVLDGAGAAAGRARGRTGRGRGTGHGGSTRGCPAEGGRARTRRGVGEPLHGYLGIEPLSRGFTSRWLREALARRGRSAIKPLLLDQTEIAGIGNIYDIEALWRARIHPLRTAGSLRADEAERLHEALRWVLRKGIRLGGASRRDYRDARGMKGRMQSEFNVYDRAGEPCPRCGAEIRRTVVGGRGTFHCPRCQRAPRAKAAVRGRKGERF